MNLAAWRGACRSFRFLFLSLFCQNYARRYRRGSWPPLLFGLQVTTDLRLPPGCLSHGQKRELSNWFPPFSLRDCYCTSAIWRSYKSHLTLNHPLGKLSSLMPHERLFPSSFLLIPTFLCFFSLPFFSFPRLRTPQLVIFEFSS